jgi:phosphoglycolate phosphatase
MTYFRAVFFDLDGTFADTAPDLGLALNRMRARRSLPPLAIEMVRPYASAGARGLLHLSFGLTPEDSSYELLREEFLTLYREVLCRHTRLFPGIPELLDELEGRGIAWGIVTNKPERFTRPLLAALGVASRARCIVSGDTCPHPKPHPEPLLTASREVGVKPSACLYLGDDERDVQASLAAGMRPVVARYGYLGNGKPWQAWGAHSAIAQPLELLELL